MPIYIPPKFCGMGQSSYEDWGPKTLGLWASTRIYWTFVTSLANSKGKGNTVIFRVIIRCHASRFCFSRRGIAPWNHLHTVMKSKLVFHRDHRGRSQIDARLESPPEIQDSVNINTFTYEWKHQHILPFSICQVESDSFWVSPAKPPETCSCVLFWSLTHRIREYSESIVLCH